MPERPPKLVFDTATLSNFALADATWILAKRYRKKGLLTSEVLDEVDAGIQCGHTALAEIVSLVDQRHFGIATLGADERKEFRELLRTLGRGEASCIAFALFRPATVVTDDSRARRICGDKGIPFTGTVGILKASCLDRQLSLDQAEEVLAAMIEAGFYSPVRRLTEVMP